MSYNKYIGIIGVSGLFAWLGWFLVINKLTPFESMGVALSLFFVTFFIALASTFTVLGFYFRVWLYKNEVFYQHINVAFRQGIFLSMIAIFCLIFQMMRVLSWWSGILLIIIAVLLEFYFSSKESGIA